MSLSERAAPARIAILALLGLAAATAAGCTVQPLHGEITSATGAGTPSAALSSVEVKPVDDRVGQEVRNHLIFLLHGGAGQPAAPAYQLALTTTSTSSSSAAVTVRTSTLEPTSAIQSVRGTYTLTEAATGRVVSRGSRTIQAAYDIPRQEYAAVRARRDAENRAARELAELLRMVVGQELRQTTSTTVPDLVTTPEDVDALSAGENADTLFPPTED
jgi:LPS-assembly lipoprotein